MICPKCGKENKMRQQIDVVALNHIIHVLRTDVNVKGYDGINSASMLAIAGRIESALGAPVMQETRQNGAAVADELFRGSPSHRAGFNAGVAWTLQQWPNLPSIYATAEFVKCRVCDRLDMQEATVKSVILRLQSHLDKIDGILRQHLSKDDKLKAIAATFTSVSKK